MHKQGLRGWFTKWNAVLGSNETSPSRALVLSSLVMVGLLTVSGCARQAPAPVDREPVKVREALPTFPRPQPPVNVTQPAPQAQRTVKVGLLLPMTGGAGQLGRSMHDAALLALNDKYLSLPQTTRDNTQIILIPKDTKGTVNDAMAAAQQAIQEGAEILVGPVFGKALAAVKPIASAKNVPVIAFSNDKTTAGRGAYLMSFMPEQQIQRIVEYAHARGVRSIAAMLPNDAYGQTVYESMEQTAGKLGMKVSAVAYYPRGAQDMTAELRELFNRSRVPHAPTEQAYQPRVNFQALLIPEGGSRLNLAAHNLNTLGVNMRDILLLGSGQWDDDNVRFSPQVYGGWFASSDPNRRTTFNQHFRNTYGYMPERLASLSYDAMALVTTLAYSSDAMTQKPGMLFNRANLTNPAGFNGPVDGIFRFLPNGMCERGLAVLEVTPDGFRVIDPAPTGFVVMRR